MTRRYPATSFAPLYVAVLVLAGALALQMIACRGTQRQDTLRTAVISLNVARDGYVAWDLEHQKAIVEKATTREEAEVQLIAYRAKRDAVTNSFEAAYRAVALAATQSDDPSLKAALEATSKILEQLDKIRGGL